MKLRKLKYTYGPRSHCSQWQTKSKPPLSYFRVYASRQKFYNISDTTKEDETESQNSQSRSRSTFYTLEYPVGWKLVILLLCSGPKFQSSCYNVLTV